MLKDNFKFLIVGAGRGGTSLLAGLLDCHPGLEVGFELFSRAYLMGEELPYDGPNIFHERVTAFISACNQQANQYPDLIWGNKITTEQIYALEDHNLINKEANINVLDMLFNNYLRDKAIIFIIRDGRTCINSKVQRTGQPIELACRRWLYSVDCYKFFKTCHLNNICVRFEDLLVNPTLILTDICNFLKIPFQKEMLRGVQNEKMLPEYRHDSFDISKTTFIDLPDDWLAKIKDQLKYCGYLASL